MPKPPPTNERRRIEAEFIQTPWVESREASSILDRATHPRHRCSGIVRLRDDRPSHMTHRHRTTLLGQVLRTFGRGFPPMTCTASATGSPTGRTTGPTATAARADLEALGVPSGSDALSRLRTAARRWSSDRRMRSAATGARDRAGGVMIGRHSRPLVPSRTIRRCSPRPTACPRCGRSRSARAMRRATRARTFGRCRPVRSRVRGATFVAAGGPPFGL